MSPLTMRKSRGIRGTYFTFQLITRKPRSGCSKPSGVRPVNLGSGRGRPVTSQARPQRQARTAPECGPAAPARPPRSQPRGTGRRTRVANQFRDHGCGGTGAGADKKMLCGSPGSRFTRGSNPSGPAPEQQPTSGWCVACARAVVVTTAATRYLNSQLHMFVSHGVGLARTARRARAKENP